VRIAAAAPVKGWGQGVPGVQAGLGEVTVVMVRSGGGGRGTRGEGLCVCV